MISDLRTCDQRETAHATIEPGKASLGSGLPGGRPGCCACDAELSRRRTVDSVRGMTAPASPATQQNRDRWLRFVDSDLGRALRQYDGAPTVAQRLDSLNRVYGALNALQQTNASHPWIPSQTLQMALN